MATSAFSEKQVGKVIFKYGYGTYDIQHMLKKGGGQCMNVNYW